MGWEKSLPNAVLCLSTLAPTQPIGSIIHATLNLPKVVDCGDSRNAPLAPAPHAAPQLRDGENPLQAVRRLRDEITQLDRELIQLRRAALPSAELKMKAREYVRELSLAGTPSLHTQDAQFRVDWPPGSQMAMGSLGPGSLAITCWLFGDAESPSSTS